MIHFQSIIRALLEPHFKKLNPMLEEIFQLNIQLHREYHNIIVYQGNYYSTYSTIVGRVVRNLHKSLHPSMQIYHKKLADLLADESFIIQELTRLAKKDKSLVHVRAQLPTFTLIRLQNNAALPALAYTEIDTLLSVTEFPELTIDAIADKIHLYTALEMVT
jgi:vacuolar-type H+-ATPase catalytic subunit A/Vma1